MTADDLLIFNIVLGVGGFLIMTNMCFPITELFIDRSKEIEESDKLAEENMKTAELLVEMGDERFEFYRQLAWSYQRPRINDNWNKIAGNLFYSFPALFLWGIPLLTISQKISNENIGLFIAILNGIILGTTAYLSFIHRPFLQVINTVIASGVFYVWFKFY